VSRPTILSVHDDPQVSAALTRDLERRYGSEYRVSATSAAQAWELRSCLALRTDPVALIDIHEGTGRVMRVSLPLKARD
jgi:thioredoxin reductase (NADPH)